MPLQPFRVSVPQDGKTWWLRLGHENLPEKFALSLLLDTNPESYLKHMEDVQILSQFGEYTVYSGVFEGERLGIVYHGSGSFSVSTAIEELASLGVKAVLRVASCGGLADDSRVGDVVVCAGGIREDRIMLDYVPLEYPAVPDRRMVEAELLACQEMGIPCREALNLSTGTIYPGSGYETARGILDQTVLDRVHLWKRVGAFSVDIETSTVLVMARLFGMAGGSLLSVANNANTGEGVHMSKEAIDQIALAGLKSLHNLKLD